MPEILPGVHQIEGVDPSPDFSTHVYLVKNKDSTWALIDAGLPGSESATLAHLARLKVDPKSVKQIVITHLHRDHTGGLKHLAKTTGARTYAHWIEAAYIAMDPPYDGPGTPPAEPFQVDERIKDGDSLDFAGGLVAYHTPGHTPGHTSYFQAAHKILFSGDLFFVDDGKLLLTPPDFTLHTPTAKISARRVSTLGAEALLTYHGGPILKGGHASLEHLLRTL